MIQQQWTTFMGYWATAFPTKKLALMFTDSASFPFNTYPSATLQKMIQNMIALYPSASIVMNNAAKGASPYIVNKLTCYTTGVTGCLPPPTGFTQPKHAIAAQEGTQITTGSPPSCGNTTAFNSMQTTSLNAQVGFMEDYDQDIKCLP